MLPLVAINVASPVGGVAISKLKPLMVVEIAALLATLVVPGRVHQGCRNGR